ncbi:hypothetical protein B0J13DRAFT_551707 [Dactylonectria estremocensis]|uniref:Uncharacterized protein n=1 Tax=Dactylonectria estremocensis TaxID=1079267 RepID=A0A9P9F1L5_9HYPO|nr:hypothetical protein B0J13DRAFT_551707 [Dactylonectria estremocensis]
MSPGAHVLKHSVSVCSIVLVSASSSSPRFLARLLGLWGRSLAAVVISVATPEPHRTGMSIAEQPAPLLTDTASSTTRVTARSSPTGCPVLEN